MAPNGLALELPRPGPLAEAKLLSLPVPALPKPAPPPKPLPRPEDPRVANPEAAVLANGDAPANPLTAGFSVDAESAVAVAAALKTEGVFDELPNVPNGDCSDFANDANPDAANEDGDVTLFFGCSPWVDWAPPNDANGETAEVFRNDFGRDGYPRLIRLFIRTNTIISRAHLPLPTTLQLHPVVLQKRPGVVSSHVLPLPLQQTCRFR